MSIVDIDPHQYKQNAEVLYSELTVASAISGIATALNTDYQDKEPPIVLSIMTGAAYFTGQLLPLLDFPLLLDYVHATRYEGGVEGKSIRWIAKPKAEVSNKTVLLLDDILDEGITLKAVVDACYDLGAKQVKVAVLADKNLNKTKPIKADYVGITVPNRYIFGCGMDINGWWRNLPAIYGLKE